jgi:hypothetical protein
VREEHPEGREEQECPEKGQAEEDHKGRKVGEEGADDVGSEAWRHGKAGGRRW